MDAWERRIRRAEQLAAGDSPSTGLVAFYLLLLRAQQGLSEVLSARPLTGDIDADVPRLVDAATTLLTTVVEHGPQQLASEANRLIQSSDEETLRDLLLTYWREPSDRLFFGKAILQPYAARLAAAAPDRPIRAFEPAGNRCPACGGVPQLAILEASAADFGDGSGRLLQCATCLSEWRYRRVSCASCGEDDEHRLAGFHSPELDHLRIDACDSCRRYLKTIDLGRLGLAVPLVDEVAGAPLDVWARDRGYDKIALNLVGL